MMSSNVLNITVPSTYTSNSKIKKVLTKFTVNHTLTIDDFKNYKNCLNEKGIIESEEFFANHHDLKFKILIFPDFEVNSNNKNQIFSIVLQSINIFGSGFKGDVSINFEVAILNENGSKEFKSSKIKFLKKIFKINFLHLSSKLYSYT